MEINLRQLKAGDLYERKKSEVEKDNLLREVATNYGNKVNFRSYF